MDGSEFVDDHPLPWDPSFLTDGKMGYGMSAERNQPGNPCRVQIMGFEITRVQADHTCQVAPCRMPAYKNGVRGASEAMDVANRPSHDCRCIFYVQGSFGSWT